MLRSQDSTAPRTFWNPAPEGLADLPSALPHFHFHRSGASARSSTNCAHCRRAPFGRVGNTAAKYSSKAALRRRSGCLNAAPACSTPVGDTPAGGSGRRGRRFKSCHPDQHHRRSSLKERGRVKALVTSDLGCFRPRRTRRNGRRGQGSGGARPRSGRRALRLAPGSTNNVGGEDSSGAVPQKSEWVGGALVKAGVPAGGQARVGCRSSLRRGRGRHDGVRGALAGGVNQRGDHARCWGS